MLSTTCQQKTVYFWVAAVNCLSDNNHLSDNNQVLILSTIAKQLCCIARKMRFNAYR